MTGYKSVLPLFLATLISLSGVAADADEDVPAREAMSDAWWTGPLLAATAGTLPQGHLLIEPYLFDSVQIGHFDSQGRWRGAAYQSYYGSQTYVNYGVTDDLVLGVIPRFGFERLGDGQSASSPGIADMILQAQYKLNQFEEGHSLPTLSVNLAETLPTGRYDHLDRLGDGLGGGAYATAFSLYGQTYFWTPGGRILRSRLDLTYTLSSQVALDAVSVYGTPANFHGHANPGDGFVADLAFEYSATQNWVLALDLIYQQQNSTAVSGLLAPLGGTGAAMPVSSLSGLSQLFYLAPAVEYNWNDRVGIIVGARITGAGRNAGASATPIAALNYVY